MEKKKKQCLNLELSHFALHITGLSCLAAGCLSALFQRMYFDTGETGGIEGSKLLAILDSGGFGLATVTVLCQLAELAAIPIFAFLLTEGTARTGNFKKYFLRVLALAAVCEIPYSLLYNGRVFEATSHNIVFGSVMALMMLWFFRKFPEKTGGHMAIKVLALLGCFIWCNFLGITHGAATVLLTAILWATRDKPIAQTIAGLAGCLALSVISPVYIISAAGLIAVHMYGGKKGRENRFITYLMYPIIIILFIPFSYLI